MRMMSVSKWAITRILNPEENNSERIDRKLQETLDPQLGGTEISSQFE